MFYPPFLSMVFFTLLLLAASPVEAQQADVLEQISQTVKASNAKKLASYFGKNVQIKIQQEEGMYSKAQAEQVMKDFFSRHTLTSFELLHQGKSKGGSRYGIGKLDTAEGPSYRTYFLIKARGDHHLIEELRFETQ